LAVSDLKGRSHALSAVRVRTAETQVLEKDLMADTTRRNRWASIIRDDLHNTDQATAYDSDPSANYIP
jgi:hypothetical protein